MKRKYIKIDKQLLMQYGTKKTIWREQRARSVPNSKRELTKISEQQTNYAERNKMAEIY